jgi:4-amino-4-deoxy-L-arabinose transferase-like glycosyltransferase
VWKQPFNGKHAALILWAGWLLPEAIYFTYSTGLMHAYYLIMLGAPIAGLAAMTLWALWQIIQKHSLLGWSLSALLTAGTLAFDAYSLKGQTSISGWAIGVAGVLFVVGVALAAINRLRVQLAPVALGFLMAAMLVAPTIWSELTIFNSSTNVALPYAGPAQQGMSGRTMGQGGDDGGNSALVSRNNESSQNSSLLDYLLANTEPGTYLLAIDRATDAAAYILYTGRPVLTFGGFLGQYQEVSVDKLAALVESGQLRFILSSAVLQYQDISQWVNQYCTKVDMAGSTRTTNTTPVDQRESTLLYDCGG